MGIGDYYQYVQLREGSIIHLRLLDTPGQETFKSIVERYYRQADCCMLVYDITSRESFEEVKKYFIPKIKEYNNSILKVILVGNKSDLEDYRQVSDIEGRDLALENEFSFMETSCLENKNVSEAFTELVEITNIELNKKKSEINNISLNKKDKYANLEKRLKEEIYKNKKLEKENDKLKSNLNKLTQNQKVEINKLKSEIEKFKKENEKLKSDLSKANKVISGFQKNSNSKGNNEINILKEEIKNLKNHLNLRENEIRDLQSKIKNNVKERPKYDINDIMIVTFITLDSSVHHAVKCLATDIFAEVEEKLYQKFENLRETNNMFTANAKPVLRFKKLSENNIHDGDLIQLFKLE